jgi:hypothetical protein
MSADRGVRSEDREQAYFHDPCVSTLEAAQMNGVFSSGAVGWLSTDEVFLLSRGRG